MSKLSPTTARVGFSSVRPVAGLLPAAQSNKTEPGDLPPRPPEYMAQTAGGMPPQNAVLQFQLETRLAPSGSFTHTDNGDGTVTVAYDTEPAVKRHPDARPETRDGTAAITREHDATHSFLRKAHRHATMSLPDEVVADAIGKLIRQTEALLPMRIRDGRPVAGAGRMDPNAAKIYDPGGRPS